jgi:DNA (cytosine-5)-methyltransferase 1
MRPRTRYNEPDPYAAQWLRNLIQKQLITPGEVDERPIQDVKPSDLEPFTRCHFFAGIAGWDLALRLASFPPDRPVWTGSCPCQPFSTAGARRGFADERHLWPFWFHLIGVCRPPTVFGEQVANGSGPWLDLVCADLESADYAVGAAILPAAGVGAPHIRDRVWFVAQSNCDGKHGLPVDAEMAAVSQPVADASGAKRVDDRSQPSGVSGGFADGGSVSNSLRDPLWDQPGWSGRPNGSGAPLAREPGWWDVEPDVGRVVDGFPTRARRLRAYGNAIVPQAAAEFVKAYLACAPAL